MFVVSAEPDLGVLDALSEVTPRIPQIATAYIATVTLPAIQGYVQHSGITYEPPQRIPWGDGFATPKSRAWYFANKVPKGSKGGHYERTHALVKAWTVRMDRRSTDNFLRLVNTAGNVANYVYPAINELSGYTQVPGHSWTHWGDNLEGEIEKLNDFSTAELLKAWNYIMGQILSGKVK